MSESKEEIAESSPQIKMKIGLSTNGRCSSRNPERKISLKLLLRPLLSPLLFLVVVTTTICFLPFATVNYSMHAVSQGDIDQHKLDGYPIPVNTEHIPINVMLYGICGQAIKAELIRENKKNLMAAGNHGYPKSPNDEVYINRLHIITGSNGQKNEPRPM
jgi:hypothetical protein